MLTLVLTFCLLLLIIAGMAIGVLIKGRPIKGSCGGISALGMGTACDVCGGNPKDCDREESEKAPRTATSRRYHELKT